MLSLIKGRKKLKNWLLLITLISRSLDPLRIWNSMQFASVNLKPHFQPGGANLFYFFGVPLGSVLLPLESFCFCLRCILPDFSFLGPFLYREYTVFFITPIWAENFLRYGRFSRQLTAPCFLIYLSSGTSALLFIVKKISNGTLQKKNALIS